MPTPVRKMYDMYLMFIREQQVLPLVQTPNKKLFLGFRVVHNHIT